jgi:hypothetical protein
MFRRHLNVAKFTKEEEDEGSMELFWTGHKSNLESCSTQCNTVLDPPVMVQDHTSCQDHIRSVGMDQSHRVLSFASYFKINFKSKYKYTFLIKICLEVSPRN